MEPNMREDPNPISHPFYVYTNGAYAIQAELMGITNIYYILDF